MTTNDAIRDAIAEISRCDSVCDGINQAAAADLERILRKLLRRVRK